MSPIAETPLRPKPLAKAVVQVFREKELLVQASGISFRLLVAIIPATLFVIAVFGALDFEEIWRGDIAPEIARNVSGPVFLVIDDAVSRVIEDQTWYWVTIGAGLATFAMASTVDAVTKTLNRIHEVEDDRPFAERALNAAVIGAATGLLFLAAIAVVRLGPLAFDAVLGDGWAVEVLSFVVRWAIAAAILVAVVTLMVRVAPDMERPLKAVSVGAAVTVGSWIVISLVFGAYLEYIANYGSIFGQLATFYIALQYIALSAVVYVGGLVVDACTVRESA